MRILITGRGKSPSYQIRAEQLGKAIGATVIANATDVRGFDVTIVVKRPRMSFVEQCGIPLVWDIVDSWPQPEGNEWTRDACMGWLRSQVDAIKPAGIVAATQAMAKDCEEFDIPVLALPHHARPGQRINPIRERVRTVSYQGGKQYLGPWQQWFDVECSARGWVFQVDSSKHSPRELAETDIAVAVRAQQGYAARNWKSNCKLANMQATGTPCILDREAGYLETASGGERWADTPEEMKAALTALVHVEARRNAANRLGFCAPTLESVAAIYRAWLVSKF